MKANYFVISLMVLCCLCGCWDRQELNEVSIVAGIAIDKGENGHYLATIEVINSSELSMQTAQGDTAAILFSIEGETLAELAHKMNVGITRTPIYGHMQTLVVSEDVAREGVAPFLQFLERNIEFRNDFNMLVANGVQAKDIIGTTYPIQEVPSVKLNTQVETMITEWGGDPDVRLTDFISAVSSSGRHPIMGTVTIEGDEKKGKSVENNKKVDLDAIVVLNGMALFEDDKLQGFLTVEETRNYLWTQDLTYTTLSVPCENDKERYLGVRVSQSTTNIKVNVKNNTPEIFIDLIVETELESSQCNDVVDDLDTFKSYEKQIGQEIKDKVEGTVQKVQEQYGIDVFGFGEDLYRQKPKDFKSMENNWDEFFKKAHIHVEPTVYLRRFGMRTKDFIKDIEE